MGLRAQQRWAWAGAWLVTASAAFLLVAAEVDRYPVSPWLWLAGILVPAAAAGFMLDHYRYCLLCLVYFPLVLLVAQISEDPVAVIAAPFVPVAAALPMAIGVIARHRLRTTVTTTVSVLAGAGLAFAFLPAAHAYVEKHRTVRVHRSHPVLIDEREGTVSGAGLGDRLSHIMSTFGPALVDDPTTGYGPLAGDGNTDGPEIPNLVHERDLRYRNLFFAADNRVRYLAVADRQAQLSRGVGPGDSISLVRRAYPGLNCREETTGADADIFYPACEGTLARGVWAYIAGDYTRPGVPVSQIWLADFDLAISAAHLKPLSP